ncbi:MAG: hypothetical protein L6V82_02585 [Clostridiales bacterium]|nr:MAG: hypothetical protein L6V82_02585 [Clostridiales bacterium]
MEIKNVKFIYGGKIADNAVDITVENGKISKVSKTREKSAPRYVTLPYVDIHTHGAVTHDVTELSENALSEIGNYLLSNGIGAYLPTFVATPLTALDKAFEKLRKLSPSGAEILGAHIEGPYISIAKKGAQPVENIMTSFDEKDADFFSRNADVLKIVTLCPATKNAVALVKAIVGNGIKAQAGHDDSIDDQIIACKNAGLDGATHIYCASSGFRRVDGKITKHLGLNECAMYFDDIYTEVIADDVHIGENLFKFIYKCKGYEKIILVSDALAPCGAPVGEYILGENTPVIADGTAAYLKDKSALAGSTTNIAKMVEIIVRYGVPLERRFIARPNRRESIWGLKFPPFPLDMTRRSTSSTSAEKSRRFIQKAKKSCNRTIFFDNFAKKSSVFVVFLKKSIYTARFLMYN